ncbi:ATP-binding cassette domain-containing protein, partial [Klebsiella pneumoniae]|nr:ATP-binding cassette domain-containing protein [Klebsiella pneumoniae]
MSNLIFEKFTKIFGKGSSNYVALENINFEAESGQLILVVGPSGSGKTTFLTIAGGLQTPTNGDVKINDSTINSLSKKQQTILRLEKIGFILQSYNLVPFLTVEE